MQGSLDINLQTVTVQSGTIESSKRQVVEVGEAVQSEVTIALNNDTFLDNSEASISFSSNRPSVAKVDGNGLVTPVGGGVVTITATVTYNGQTMTDSYVLKVMPNLTATASGGTVSVEYYNPGSEAVSGSFLLAAYNNKGQLISVYREDLSAASLGIDTTVFSLNVSEYPGCTFKVFAWDEKLIPLAQAAQVI